MNEEIKESHVMGLYRLLGHTGYWSRVGSLDFSKKVVQKNGKESYLYEEEYIKGEEALIEYVRRYNGQRNIFISRAFRAAGGDVVGTYCVSFDIDPIRPKGEAATSEQHARAISAGHRILQRYSGGYLASSGNGALVVYRGKSPISNLNEHYQKEGLLIDELQKMVDDLNVRIDHTNYAQAIIKTIGTFSTKGEPSLRRCSGWITYPIPPFTDSSKLLERLTQIELPKQLPSTSINVGELHSKFNGDRSIADYNLVTFLKKSGVRPTDALQALKANPIGRQSDEKDQARLISKVYGAAATGESQETGTSEYFKNLFTPKETSNDNIRTGFRLLDTALGAFPKGELITFAARSGFGKTTLGCTLAEYWRKQGKRVLYFSTEMAKEYILHKLVALSCEIPLANVIQRQFTENEIPRIKAYEQELLRSNEIAICDEFQRKIEQVQNEVIKNKPHVIVFDHITQSSTSWQEVADFARKLKDITAKENIPTLMLSMLNEPSRNSKGELQASVRGDVRGSQEILYLSAIFMIASNIYDVKGNIQPVNIEIAKNRYGLSGLDVKLNVDKLISKFLDA